MPFRDNDYQSLDPQEFPDPDDQAGDAVYLCPHCAALIAENCDRCPACGLALEQYESPRRSWWIILGVLLCLAVSLFWIWPF